MEYLLVCYSHAEENVAALLTVTLLAIIVGLIDVSRESEVCEQKQTMNKQMKKTCDDHDRKSVRQPGN